MIGRGRRRKNERRLWEGKERTKNELKPNLKCDFPITNDYLGFSQNEVKQSSYFDVFSIDIR